MSGGEPPAGGPRAVRETARHLLRGPGVLRGASALRRMNREGGFDCPGCAWPADPHAGLLDFCENGAKALAHEATRRRADPDFFARHPVAALRERADAWLEARGRITHPMRRRPGASHFEPVSWDLAFERIGHHLGRLESPDQVVFYTSGRTSNEAAFLYQLFARRLGTNNLPDCSNLCHESSGRALLETLGSGKGTVSLQDFDRADAIFVIGQNPGSNHPRMLSALARARRRGARIVSINPLRERGLVAFAHPQEPAGLLGVGTPLAELFCRVRVGGDIALLAAIMRELLDREQREPGKVLDRGFIAEHTEGFEAFEAQLLGLDRERLRLLAGVPEEEIRRAAEIYAGAGRTIVCWAMGITQHEHGVDNVRQIVNLLLLRGNVGVPGAGALPVRGHSNVQGDRTMGIVPDPSHALLDALAREFAFEPPRRPGLDSVGALEALDAGRIRVFVGLGGNFAVANADSERAQAALGRAALGVHVATTLNRTHLAASGEAILLPCLARSERLPGGESAFVTVEDSMAVVTRSVGRLPPASPHLLSEMAIVAGMARAARPSDPLDWEALAADPDRVREHIARVIPGFHDMNRRVREPGGFVLPRSGFGGRHFGTPGGRARFTPISPPEPSLAPGELLLTTVRSHDQFNTTVYGEDDRYRGIRGGRRVVMLHPDDLARLGLADGCAVRLSSRLGDRVRTLEGFRAVAYDVPRGCAVTYFPEANPLVFAERRDPRSRTPAFKSIPVRIEPASDAPSG